MAMRVSVAEFYKFYSDPEFWPTMMEGCRVDEGVWHDGGICDQNGNDIEPDFDEMRPTDSLILDGGVVYSNRWPERLAPSLERYFRRWRDGQKFRTLAITFDKEDEVEVRAFLKRIGAKVL